MSATDAPVGARSLADDIRGRTDEQLTDLVLARPDLARPAPSDLTSLAARAGTRASVQRAIEGLDRGHLQVLEAVVVAGDGSGSGPVDELVGGVDVRTQLARLWDLALVWRAPEGLYAVRTVPEVLGPHPAGLGPSSLEVGARPLPPGEVRSLLDEAPDAARGVLDRLVWGPPVGVVNRDAPGSDGVRWLLDQRLLHVVTPTVTERARGETETRVLLPREVALILRGGRLYESVLLVPPDADTTPVGVDRVDAAAGGEVSDLLALVEEVIELWGPAPPRVLRTGGLAVRDLRRLADSLDVDSTRAAWLVELMSGAGLVADDGEVVPVWAPTPVADEWLLEPPGPRWARLAAAWLASTRAAHLVGSRLPGSSSPANALSPDLHWPPVRLMRTDVLAELAQLAPGDVATSASLLARLRWRRPLRNAARLGDAMDAVLREAGWLGVTGRGALSTAGRALVGGDDVEAVAQTMSTQLPAPVDHVLVQADLTAIAPGPLHGDLAQLMRLTSDVESRGGATVHRFTPASVRRALDAGWTADELLEALRGASRTGLPQPLEYLVRDVARRHGQTRVGGATAYIRSDDESVLESLLVERALGALRLRRIAPTVLVSSADPETLLELMREAGYSPVQERPDGTVVVSIAARRRAANRRPPAPTRTTPVDAGYAASLVRGLRAAEEVARTADGEDARPALVPTDPAVTMAALRDAAAEHSGVWIGYADMTGRTDRYLFYPTRVEGGRAWGRVADSTAERGFSVYRITGVAELAG
ncbi:MAG TPA: helicase-associated domain-containing protein [Lapillicoccus sp.]|nr:helicase-associated domain-containing protein [Lapillicoccus sp.]